MASSANNYPQLKAENFDNWLFRLESILEEKQLKHVTTTDTIDIKEENKKEFLVQDAKAKSIVIQCISDKHLNLIKDCKTSRDMINLLKEMFQRRSVISKIHLRRKLLTLKCRPNQKLEEYFAEFDNIIRELECAKEKIEETDKICYLLTGLDEKYDTVITAIETINNEVKIEFVKARLLDEELKMTNRGSDTSNLREMAFIIKCYKCNKPGHIAAECRFGRGSGRSRGFFRGGRYFNRGRGQYNQGQGQYNQVQGQYNQGQSQGQHYRTASQTAATTTEDESFMFIADRMTTLQSIAQQASKVGGVLRFWLGFRFFLAVTEPDVAEMILKTFLEKDETMDIIRDLTGNGSIFAPVSIWRPRRKLLVRAFRPKILKNFMEIFDEASRDLVKQLEKVSGGAPFSVFPYISGCTMKSVCETNLGIKMSLENQKVKQFINNFEKVVNDLSVRLCQPLLNAVFRFLPRYIMFRDSRQVLYDFVNQVIQSKKREKEEECDTDQKTDCEHNVISAQPEPRPFLDILMEHSESERLSDTDLRDEGMVITVAGTDTSSVCASFVLCMLARHPQIQDRLYEELTEVFGNSNRSVTHEDLPKLSFLDAVLKETMRLYPPVPVIVRGVDKFVSLKSGQILVPGMCCVIHIWGIHRNPKYWGQDADQFRPDRFLNSTLPHPAAFIPFSHGPRNCIGYQYAMMSLKTILATVLRSFRVLPLSGTNTTAPELTDYSGDHKPMRVQFEVMLKDADQFTIQLEKRKVE